MKDNLFKEEIKFISVDNYQLAVVSFFGLIYKKQNVFVGLYISELNLLFIAQIHRLGLYPVL